MRTSFDLHDYQQDTIDALYEHDRLQAVLPMGAGKTASALKAFKELLSVGDVRQALVLAPKRVAQLVWPAEVRKWDFACDLSVAVGIGTPGKRLAALKSGEKLIVQTIDNTQWLVEQLKNAPNDDPIFDMLIIDESSRFKNPRSKRGKALFGQIARFRNVWMLTGTPAPNGLMDQFLPMKLLTGGKMWGKSFDIWRQKYFMSDYQGYSWAVRSEWRRKLESDIRRYSITIDHSRLQALPELVINRHWVDMPADTRWHYEQMAQEFLAWVAREREKGTKEAVIAANAGVRSAKLEQLCQGYLYRNKDEVGAGAERYERVDTAKLDRAVELAEEAGGEPVIIAYHFNAELDGLRERFKGLRYLGAGVKDTEAAQIERDWNAGKIPVLAIHPASAGHGLNLQHGGRRVIWMMPIWSAEMWDQTIKRVHRQGQIMRTFIDVICSDPHHEVTIDEVKIMRVQDKMTFQEALVSSMKKAGEK